jgi:sigma-B regulation protein RsbU (phosphoserine phosphatase)
MKNFSQFHSFDARRVPVVNWRTARGFDYASFSLRGNVPGGDYVDFIPMPNGEFALMLGETDAKGRRAAWTSACIRGAVRGFIARGHVSPMKLANELNRILYELCSLDQIVSFLYAHYSAVTGVFTYVNAGHESALLLQNGHRRVSLLELGGPVLGLKANSTYREGSVRLRAGDRVLAFTTGVIDALASTANDSAEDELLEISRDYEDTDSRDLAGAILNRIADANATDSANDTDYTNTIDLSRDRSLVVVSQHSVMPGVNQIAAQKELALAT